MRIIILIGIVLIIIISCNHISKKEFIYSNKTFDEIISFAKEENLPFCFILIDSTSISQNEYLRMYKEHNKVSKNVIFNFINIDLDDNNWYNKLLSPRTYPVACIFNSYGELIDLIPGDTKESFFYTNQVINELTPSIDFHFNQKYDNKKIEIINYTNSVLRIKNKIDKNKNVADIIDSLLRIKDHPYVLFLQMQNFSQFGDKKAAKMIAQKFLQNDSIENLLHYQNEFFLANKILDSTYIYTAPLIYSSTKQINLSKCNTNHSYLLSIKIFNKGIKPLKISDIITSCSCVELVSVKKHVINSSKSKNIKFIFTPDIAGDLFREIHIVSNSIHTPIYTITIKAKANTI